jgi:hypothetical protein
MLGSIDESVVVVVEVVVLLFAVSRARFFAFICVIKLNPLCVASLSVDC